MKPYYLDITLFDTPRSYSITLIRHSSLMNTPIQFYSQPELRTIKVNDIRTNPILSAKLKSFDLLRL